MSSTPTLPTLHIRDTVIQAITHGDLTTLKQLDVTLLERLNAFGGPQVRLLPLALRHRQLHVAAWLVEESERTGKDIACEWKSIHIAGLRGAVDRLVAAADDELRDAAGFGDTVLHAAAAGDQAQVVKYLVYERGMDVNVKDSNRLTPLQVAARYGCLAAMDVLVQCGSSVEDGRAVPSVALDVATDAGQLDAMEWLVQHGASINGASGLRYSVLVTAVRTGRLDVVDCALRLGADVRGTCRGGKTALHATTSADAPAIVERLVQSGVPLDVADDSGQTPLHLASAAPRVCSKLLELGADRWVKDRRGRTAYDIAVMAGEYGHDVAQLLSSYYPITPPVALLLLGLRGPTPSPLTRFAAHSAFEPKVLSLVNSLLTGKPDGAFRQLQTESSSSSSLASRSSSSASSSQPSKKARQG